jgi:hypothetical protein
MKSQYITWTIKVKAGDHFASHSWSKDSEGLVTGLIAGPLGKISDFDPA